MAENDSDFLELKDDLLGESDDDTLNSKDTESNKEKLEVEAEKTGEAVAKEEAEEKKTDEFYIVLSDDDSQDAKEASAADGDDLPENEAAGDGSAQVDIEELASYWNDLDEKDVDDREEIDEGFNAEDLEMMELTLPQQTFIKDKALHLWNSRKLIAYPVPGEDLRSSKVDDLMNDAQCQQFTVHVKREKPNSETWTGILDLVFCTREQSVVAMEKLKEQYADIRVLNAASVNEWSKEFDESRSSHFSSYESKRWPSCLVCVKYLPSSVTTETLRDTFPDAFEVMLYTSDRPNLTESQRLTGLIFYQSPEEAEEAVLIKNENKVSIDGVRLAFFKYDRLTHPQNISSNLLPLSERYVILRERIVVEKIAERHGGHCVAALEKFNKRIKEDEAARKNYGLPCPTLVELRAMNSLRILSRSEAYDVIKRLDLLWRNRDKLLLEGPGSSEPAIRSENKGMYPGPANPNKRKRRIQGSAGDSFRGTRPARPVGPPSLFQRNLSVRPPFRKLMRMERQQEEAVAFDGDIYDEIAYREQRPTYAEQLSYGQGVRNVRLPVTHPQSLGPLVQRPRLPLPQVQRPQLPRLPGLRMMGANGGRNYQDQTLESRVAARTARLFNLVHNDMNAGRSVRMARPHSSAYIDDSYGADDAYGAESYGVGMLVGRPGLPPGQGYMGVRNASRRGVVGRGRGRGSGFARRPLGRAGWAA